MTAAKDIREALIKAATDIGAIGKDSKNTEQHYSFRGIDTLMDKAAPAFREHGIVVMPEHKLIQTDHIQSSRGTPGYRTLIASTFTFSHTSGTELVASSVGEGVDYGDKSANKAMAQAFKYALFQALTIPLGDTDPDAESPEAGAPTKSQGRRPAKDTTRGSVESSRSTSRRSTVRTARPTLVYSPDDRDDDGWWPVQCPSCGSDVQNKKIRTKNGESPLWECTDFQGCRDWPGRERKDGDGFYPWSEFGASDDEAKIWGPGGWVDDHMGGSEVVREEYDEAPF